MNDIDFMLNGRNSRQKHEDMLREAEQNRRVGGFPRKNQNPLQRLLRQFGR